MTVKKLIELLEKLNQEEEVEVVAEDGEAICGITTIRIIRINPHTNEWTVNLFDDLEDFEDSYLRIAIVTE